jgi:hypothetical protein
LGASGVRDPYRLTVAADIINIRDTMIPSRRLGWLVCGAIAASGAAHAQDSVGRSVTLRGVVIDTAHHPIPGVLVYLSTAHVFTVTGTKGEFTLAGVGWQADTLQLRGMRFAPRAFRLNLPDTAQDTVDVGTVLLGPGPPPSLDLIVTVRDTVQHRPVAAAQVLVNDRVVGLTDSAGRLQAQQIPVEWWLNLVLVRRIGYAPLLRLFRVEVPEERGSVAGVMEPNPVALPAVGVEADRITLAFGRMRDFWRRRAKGLGRFVTRAEIEQRHAIHVSDLLQGIPGLQVTRRGATTLLQSTRGVPYCTPAVWVDRSPLDLDLDASVNPDEVEGIEVYLGAGEAPAEYSGAGNACGAIVVWTR